MLYMYRASMEVQSFQIINEFQNVNIFNENLKT